MNSKIQGIITLLKIHDWHGDGEEEDGLVHLWAERGPEMLDIWFTNGKPEAEHIVNETSTTLRSTPAIRQVIEALPAVKSRHKRQKLPFGPHDDDATILDGLVAPSKIYCASLIYDDFPLVEHAVADIFSRIVQPKVIRFADGRVNVDYVGPTGFKSLRVNNIVRMR